MKSLVVVWLIAAAIALCALVISILSHDPNNTIWDGTILAFDLFMARWQYRSLKRRRA